jgi:glycerol-3-phosphate dehydrogenase
VGELNQIPLKTDVLIVGGGCTGVGIFRDLALHGVDCLLIDAKDFASQTSSASSKMLHGGIRYLESFDFALVKEALHEKNLWLKLAPNLCQELPFYLPVYWESKYPFLWMTKVALKTYDFLSGFQNSAHKILRAKETILKLPGIKKEGLKGAGVYYDAIVDDAKLTLECLYDSLLEPNANAFNYTKIDKVEAFGDSYKAELTNTLTGEKNSIIAKKVVFATGPFSDDLLMNLGFSWKNRLLPTKGSHLWIRKNSLDIPYPLVLQTFDGRIIFVIPQRDAILVGTTEIQAKGDFFDLKCSEEEIDYLLKNLQEFFPAAGVSRKDILSTFAGIRPLVKKEGGNAHNTSREHQVFRPGKNLYVIFGGKYTTFRVMGREISSEIVHGFGGTYNPGTTLQALRQPSVFPTFTPWELSEQAVLESLSHEKVRTFSDLIHRRMGLLSLSNWNHKKSFVDFFTGMLDDMSRYIIVNKAEITKFWP